MSSDLLADAPVAVSKPRGQLIGPLTTAGAGCLVLGVATYVAGWRLGWIELLVVAAACILALLLALPFIVGRSRLQITRSFQSNRVSVGDSLIVGLVAENLGRGPARRVDVEERIGSNTLVLPIPGLAPQGSHELSYPLDTSRRARLNIGPALISRADPLGLLRRQVAQSAVDECWVYPESRLVPALPVGFAKDLEGPTSDTSPVGDVAFHAIRPYVNGDDRRHIHWMSTAKTGSLMVRHYVDNRRPHTAILLDDDVAQYSPDHFETAVSIVASLSASMLRQRLPVSVRIGDTTVIGDHVAGDTDSALEALTVCEPTERAADDLLVSAAEFIRFERAASALIVITGKRPDTELLPLAVHVRRSARIIVVPVADAGEGAVALPGARVLPVDSLDQFVVGWSGTTR